MNTVKDRDGEGAVVSPTVTIVAGLQAILVELDRLGESFAAIHVNNAIEVLQAANLE